MNTTNKHFILLFLLLFQGIILSQWFEKSNGLQKDFDFGYAIDAIDSANAIITYVKSGIYITIDGGENWESVNFESKKNGEVVDIEMITKENIWLCTDKGRIFSSENKGIDWILQFYDTTKTKFMNYLEMFDSLNGIAMGDALDRENDPAVFLKTIDGGKTWNSINDSVFGGISGDGWRMLDFINTEIGFFLESGIYPQGIYKTIDGCKTWEKINYSGVITNLKFFNSNIGLRYEINAKEIQRTLNGGTTWTSFIIDSAGWGNDFEFIPNDPSKVWFTDFKDMYYSNDTGSTWTKQIMPKEKIEGRDIVFTDNNNGWLLSNRGYVYRTSNNGGMITDVKKIETNNLPTEFNLSQNYPNPFNPTTTIKYTLPLDEKRKTLDVKLIIYDLLGKEVATLVNEKKLAGNYQVNFDASNLTSGIYFYSLTSGNFKETKKLILLK
ncbi:MAG: YCF48-related protein [Melioribacteraceae bacterium]